MITAETKLRKKPEPLLVQQFQNSCRSVYSFKNFMFFAATNAEELPFMDMFGFIFSAGHATLD